MRIAMSSRYGRIERGTIKKVEKDGRGREDKREGGRECMSS